MQKTICALLALLLLAACSTEKKYKLSGAIEGEPTMNLYVKYFTNGSYAEGVTPVVNGKFSFEGNLPEPALLTMLDNENRLLGLAYVQNGDKVSMHLSRTNPYLSTAKGSEANEQWTAFANANADALFGGDPRLINELVETFGASHQGSIAACMAFANCYDARLDPARADSVMRAIAGDKPETAALLSAFSVTLSRYADGTHLKPVKELRLRTIKQDSAITFKPKKPLTLLAFTDANSMRHAQVLPTLRRLAEIDSLEILDIMLTPDTMQWRNEVRLDSVAWTLGWMPGGIYAAGVDSLALPRLPYFILLGPDGRQLRREASLDSISSALLP